MPRFQLPPATILIVDDSPVLLDVLREQLWTYGLRVRLAHDGEEGVAQAQALKPDLILLDVMMPGIDGLEACRRLKADPKTATIPVIFMTALQNTEDKLAGFGVGAVDYLTKPVDIAEVVARISTHLKLQATTRALQREIETRRATEAALGQRTEEAEHNLQLLLRSEKMLVNEKMAAAGQLSAGLAHEINNPTHYAALAAQNLEGKLEEFHDFLLELAGGDTDPEILSSIERRFAPLREQLQTILEGTRRVLGIVQDLRTFARADEPGGGPARLVEALMSTLNLVRAKYKHDIVFDTHFVADPEIVCHAARLNQVFMNLVVNACQAIHHRARQAEPGYQGRVVLGSRIDGDQLCISVEDNGCGIDEAARGKIFEPFFTTKAEGEGTGLGLTLSLGIVNDHGGQLAFESVAGGGARFTLRLPLHRA